MEVILREPFIYAAPRQMGLDANIQTIIQEAAYLCFPFAGWSLPSMTKTYSKRYKHIYVEMVVCFE